MGNINTRLDTFISSLGVSKNQFATSLGTSSAMISKITKQKVNFGVDILEKIITTYPHLNQQWLLTGIGEMNKEIHTDSTHLSTHLSDNLETKGSSKENGQSPGINDVLFLGDYTENRIAFYYRHSQQRVDALLSVSIDDFKNAFNDYLKLIKVSNNLGAPEFLVKKYEVSTDFKKYRKELDEDIKEDHKHITDQKLLKCVLICRYIETTEHFLSSISKLIEDMFNNLTLYKR